MSTESMTGVLGEAARKRRVHSKSRRGCGNCKLRRVKCDESRPRCSKCLNYGVSCNYDPKYTDLQMSLRGASKVDLFSPVSANLAVLGMINGSLKAGADPTSTDCLQLEMWHMDLLYRFQTRTVLTIGTDSTKGIYQREVMNLACRHPFLMHVILTMTMHHDRYLSDAPFSKQSAVEAYHWYSATSLFNQALSRPLVESSKDALWATAAILGAVSMSYIDATIPEESWPLKHTSVHDLDWLRLSDGKREVWRMADLSRPESVFNLIAKEQQWHAPPPPPTRADLTGMSEIYINLFGLQDGTDSNPYMYAGYQVARLSKIHCNRVTITKFLHLIGFMQAEFKALLEVKDARALLLLAYWFGMVCQYRAWFLWKRSVLEGQSICLYLEKYHASDAELQELLKTPKMMCGLGAKNETETIDNSKTTSRIAEPAKSTDASDSLTFVMYDPS